MPRLSLPAACAAAALLSLPSRAAHSDAARARLRGWVQDVRAADIKRYGLRDGLAFEGFAFQLMEGQYAKGEFGTWRAFLYDAQTGAADTLAIATDGGSRNFANPSWTLVRINGRQALLMTFFVPSERAAPGEAGELLSVHYLDAPAVLGPARARERDASYAFPEWSGRDALGRAPAFPIGLGGEGSFGVTPPAARGP